MKSIYTLLILSFLSTFGVSDEITGLNLRTTAGSQAINPTAVAGAVLSLDANKKPTFGGSITTTSNGARLAGTLQFVGSTASYPMIKRNGTGIDVRLADDSAYAPIAASTVSAGGTAVWSSGAGSPEGVVTAAVGSLYTRTDGGAATTLYVKESGAGNTGWVATGAATGGGTKTIARFFPADNEPPTANFATLDTRNSHPVLDFDTTTQETAIFREFIPEGASLTNGVTVYIQWAATSATSGTVGWDVSFERVDTTLDLDADNFGAAQTVTAASVSGTSGVSSNTSVNFTQAQLPASLAAGEMYRVRVRRDVANDTATGDAELLGVEIRLQ